MGNLQKYQFYLILGAILLVYIIFYFLAVAPKKNMLAKKLKDLEKDNKLILKKQKENTLPNENLITFYQKRKESLTKSQGEMEEFLKNKDEKFEFFFKELVKSDKLPEISEFHDIYYDRKKKLINDYTKNEEIIIRDDESTKTIEEILPLAEEASIGTSNAMRQRQKEFWIIKGILSICKKGKVKTLYSFSPIKYDTKSKGPAKRSKDDVCEAHIVEFAGMIDYADIPYLIEALLYGYGEMEDNTFQQFMVEIISIKVERKKDYKPKQVTFIVEHDEKDIKSAKEAFRQKNKEKLQRELPPVKIKCECRILDYEPLS